MDVYKHGAYSSTTTEEPTPAYPNGVAQCVIGTAPIHMIADSAAAVNTPVLCKDMKDCRNKIGYSTDFENYTLCQSMYASFEVFGVGPVVFINVLDPAKHFEETTATITVAGSKAVIGNDVITSSLVIKSGSATIEADKYSLEWVNGELVAYFTDMESGSISAEYNKIMPSKVTASDILGTVDMETDERTGMEAIRSVFPKFGYVPFLLSAPGWSEDDTVGAMLAEKTKLINGCYTAKAILDLEATSRVADKIIENKKGRTLNENCIALFPKVKVKGNIISYSAYMSALIMHQATETGGVVCSSPSNTKISIDDCVLNDGTSVYFDQEDGNVLNAEGIVTIIARNGWYAWGNNMAVYPDVTVPEKRWISMSLTFAYNDNDFINSNFENIDRNISRKLIENAIINQNIKLSSWKASGYIAGGEMYYNAAENTEDEILAGHFKVRTRLSGNIPMEYFENETEFDAQMLINAIIGGEE